MIRFFNRLSSRMPETWAGRAMWFAIALVAFWFAYTFGVNYGMCRGDGTNKSGCVAFAALSTPGDLFLDGMIVAGRILSLVLP